MGPSIPEFYSGKTIFITGGTGFIGKVLIEKLLRSCPEVQRIYCLVRSKRGKDMNTRLEEMFQLEMYNQLREEQPSFMERVVAVGGDVMDEGLGLSDEDRARLQEEVHIVFHSAATVRFDEHLRIAVKMNIEGVMKMIDLCRNCKRLETLVHVSTAFCNLERSFIEEKIYPPPVVPEKLLSAMECLDDQTITLITPQLLGDKPNTYTYTKHLAETLLVKEASDLPLAIVRPSIVTAAWKEPMPGWVDNLNNVSGMCVAAGKGLLRTMLGHRDKTADIVPVDLSVNMMIVAAWHTASLKKTSDPLVYHITSGNVNPVTWDDMQKHVIPYFYQYPLDTAFRRPQHNIITPYRFINDSWVFVSHMLHAYAADLLLFTTGRKPRMVKLYNKLHKGMAVLKYFSMRSWDWTHRHMDMLIDTMNANDRQTFYLDPRGIIWADYMIRYAFGIKTYFLKEDVADYPKARAHLTKLGMMRSVFNVFLTMITWRFLASHSAAFRTSWTFMMTLVSRLFLSIRSWFP